MKPLVLQDAILVLSPIITSNDIIAVSCIWRAPSTTDLISWRVALCLRPRCSTRHYVPEESDRCEAGIAERVPTHSDKKGSLTIRDEQKVL